MSGPVYSAMEANGRAQARQAVREAGTNRFLEQWKQARKAGPDPDVSAEGVEAVLQETSAALGGIGQRMRDLDTRLKNARKAEEAALGSYHLAQRRADSQAVRKAAQAVQRERKTIETLRQQYAELLAEAEAVSPPNLGNQIADLEKIAVQTMQRAERMATEAKRLRVRRRMVSSSWQTTLAELRRRVGTNGDGPAAA